MKTYLHNNDIDAERFIRNLKNKMYKYMNSVSKNVYIDKWDDIVHKYNNTYHSTITMKPVGVESNTYVDSSKEIIDKDPKFKIGKIVGTLKNKNIFAKAYIPNWSEEDFVIKKVKNTVPWIYVLKRTISGMRQFLATAFYSTLKALFVLKIFEFLSWLFGHAQKWLD